jgi:glutamate formiminotransferase / formiminotetrahydrofolate cyclodeaminase
MAQLVECVPNFSEGRRREVVDQLIAAITAVPGVTLLDSEMDPDHNRSVVTFAGSPDAAVEAAVRVAARAAELIDLTQHQGQHPRMGATDVLPFVPIEDLTLEDCANLAREAGRRIGELGIPVFLYEAAASRPDRVSLADVRRGEFEGLRDLIGKDPTRTPDFGPARIHPKAGATAVGARRFLVAFNANLNTGDVRVAKAVAKTIREQSGGLKHVRALGFSIEGGRRAQVSMNLVNTEATPIHRVLTLIREEAARHGAAISGCEVVGLIPEAAMLDAAEHLLQLEGFRRDQVLELRLKRPPISEGVTFGQMLDQVAAATPTPGGGTVVALTGALASALTAMVANLSIGRKKYAGHEPELREAQSRSVELRRELLGLARQDSESFEQVLRATRMPHATTDEQRARDRALSAANLEASRVPLRTAQACLAILELATRVAKWGNVNAITDAGVGSLLARAAGEGALLNVEINLKSVPPSADKEGVEMELRRLQAALGAEGGSCMDAVRATFHTT